MRITRETDYAVRCVYYLSDKKDGVVMIDEIACEMSAPKSFTAKIMQKLAKAGIVRSFRGVKGGFQLVRKPSDISLLDVIYAVQGPVAINVCALDKRLCDRSAACAIHPVWVEIREKVERLLGSKDFATLHKIKKREEK